MILKLNQGWKFALEEELTKTSGESDKEVWEKDYLENGWNEITIPHDWAVSKPFQKEYSSGTGYVCGGIGWYRLHFIIPEEYRDYSVRIVFDGIYKRSKVWCNGYYLGNWASGYTRSYRDISNFVSFGQEENVIVVKVSHEDLADSRWYTGSGINRQVSLSITEKLHLVQDGIYFHTEKMEDDQAKIQIDTLVTNELEEEKSVAVMHILSGKDGSIDSFEEHITLFPRQTLEVKITGSIRNVKAWSVKEPNLYELRTILRSEQDPAGNLVGIYDEIRQNVGIRETVFDSDHGFYLNKINMKLKGVCIHEDLGCLGTIESKSIWKDRLKKLKAAGCNAIRMSHNPHAQCIYELCDELGLLVVDEAFDEWEGPKNKWFHGHNVYPPKHNGYYEDFTEWYAIDIKAQIEANRNHPSIIMWSIGNEIDYPNDPYCHPSFALMTGNNDANKPQKEREYNANRPNMDRLAVLAARLANEVRRYDKVRPVTLAAAFPELSSKLGFFDPIDVIGYNYKEQYYEQDHKRFCEKAILGSENSHSYEAFRAATEKEYIAGQFLWTGIDYLGEAHGWPIRGSASGLLTLAGCEKPIYYYRKSLWSEKPTVHIVTTRVSDEDSIWSHKEIWNYVPGELVRVIVYTNQSGVELWLNERTFGKKIKEKEEPYLSWQVPYEEGTLRAVAINGSCMDTLTTTGQACQMLVAKMEEEWIADGHQITRLELTMTDACGQRVYSNSSMVFVEVSGEATLAGLESGDIADLTEYSANYRRAFQGKLVCYLRSTCHPGEAKIIFKSEFEGKIEVTINSLRS